MMTDSKALQEFAQLLSEALGQTIKPVEERIDLVGDDPLDRVQIEQGRHDRLVHFMIPLHAYDESAQSVGDVVNLLLQLNADVHQLGQARMAFNSAQGEFMLMDHFRPDLSGALIQLNDRRALAQRIREAIRQFTGQAIGQAIGQQQSSPQEL